MRGRREVHFHISVLGMWPATNKGWRLYVSLMVAMLAFFPIALKQIFPEPFESLVGAGLLAWIFAVWIYIFMHLKWV